MSEGQRIAYHFATLRVVPHVFSGAFINVGVILRAATLDLLDMRVLDDIALLKRCAPDVDHELLTRYLQSCMAVCRGDAAAGPIALLSPAERFTWLTSPRSDVLQASPVLAGITTDIAATLDELYTSLVLEPARRLCGTDTSA
jgi:hypothetical protein